MQIDIYGIRNFWKPVQTIIYGIRNFRNAINSNICLCV